MKKWFKEQENRISLAVFLVVVLIACSPLITKLCINGHDLEYHLLRIESLKEGILTGHPFGRINVLFFGGAGYASSLFYPDLLLYLPALLRTAGVGINASYHIFVVVCICLTYLSTNRCVRKITGSSYAAMIASIIMVLCPYYLGDVLIRGAVGEYTAFIFLPFVIYGIYNVLYEEMDRPYILGIGYGGILLCHTNTFIFCLLFGAVAFLVKWKVFRQPRVLMRLLTTAGVTAFLTMFYWAPVLEMLFTTGLYVNDAWIGLEQTALQFASVFSMTFPCLGFVVILPALFRILIKKNAQNRNLVDYADWLLAGGLLFALLSTDLIPWQKLNTYLSFVQFPWRLFVLASAMLAISDAIILYVFIRYTLEPHMQGSLKVLTVLTLIVFTAFSFRFISDAGITYYDYSDDYYSYKPYTANVIAGEWLPKTVEKRDDLVKDSEHMVTETGEDLPFERNSGKVSASIEQAYDYVDVPLIYYRGYAASIEKDGVRLKLAVSAGKNGLCRVSLNGNTGLLRVYYAGTQVQIVSSIFSILTLIGIVLLLYKKKRTQKTEE